MATTTNYGWTTPDDTALVKDGASAIRTLGSSVDTTVKALSPGTTAGDIDYYTAATTKARVGIGTNGQVLTSNGSVPSWVTPSGGLTLLSTTTLSGASTTISAISGSYTQLFIVMTGIYASADNAEFAIRFNSDTGTEYVYSGYKTNVGGGSIAFAEGSGGGHTRFFMSNTMRNTDSLKVNLGGTILLPNYTSTGAKHFDINLFGSCTTNGTYDMKFFGRYVGGAAISSMTFLTNGATTYTAGTVLIYGVK